MLLLQDVELASMAPDIAFANVPHISQNQLSIKEIIGQGGFGKVYRGNTLSLLSLLILDK